MMKKIVFWILAVVITITAAIYQRMTGPTYPKKLMAQVNRQSYELRMVRSIGLDERSEVKLAVQDTSASALLYFRRYPTNEEYKAVPFAYKTYPVNSFIMNKIFKMTEDKGFFAPVPVQPAAGKIQYYFEVTDDSGTTTYGKDNPIVIRFKGTVPLWILLPHVLAMFTAMLFSVVAALFALGRIRRYRFYTNLTFIILLIGGFLLGPLVQYFAFGKLWTGVPFGWDLTDNKTLIAIIAFLIAFLGNRKKDRPWLTVMATVLMLVVFSIPHSLLGSEFNYESGKVIQNMILLARPW
jgi:hypothetical protein